MQSFRLGTHAFYEQDVTIKDVCDAIREWFPLSKRSSIDFARQLPGFNKLSEYDFNVMMLKKNLDFFLIKDAVLFINGECYLQLPNNITYRKKWMSQIIGEMLTLKLFNFVDEMNRLELTKKEVALMIPYVLTSPGMLNF